MLTDNMFGLSPAQLSRAADDGSILGRPSARLPTAVETCRLLQEKIVAELQRINNELWRKSLPFQVILPYSSQSVVHDNILEFCSNIWKGQAIRFSSESYPPTKQGLKELTRTLELAAIVSGGVELVSSGRGKVKDFTNLTTKDKVCCRLVCSCSLIYGNKSNKLLDTENGSCPNMAFQYRKGTLHNDRLNDRCDDGKKLPKPKDTCHRLLPIDPKCPFSLAVFVDQTGFFIKGGIGNPNHQYHVQPQVNPISKIRAALLTNEQRKELEDAS
jgi:hypothetical protein